MQFLKFKIFEDHVLHAISTRDGGVSSGAYKSLDLSMRGGNVKKNYEIFSNKTGFDLKNVAIAYQKHTDKILRVDQPLGFKNAKEAIDGFMTNKKNIPLIVRFADCQGVLYFDPIKKVIAAVHCGWRGNTKNIVGKAIKKMKEEYNCDPKNILVGISQSLCPDCSEFSNPKKELPEHMHKYIKDRHVNLWQCSIDQLTAEGVLNKNIELLKRCTVCEYDKFFSFRGGKTVTGHMAAVIQLT